MGTQLLPPQKGAELPLNFLAHVCCGQTARWIKMALGIEVRLSPGHIVLDGDLAPFPKRGQSLPQFWARLYCAKRLDGSRWHDMEVGLGPGHIVLDGDPASLPQKGGIAPNFRSVYVVAKWLDGSRCHLVRR